MQWGPIHLARAPRLLTFWLVYVGKFVQRVDQVVVPRAQHLLVTVSTEGY